MDWYGSVFELIDMRSFSNLWFWIALAVMWSSVSHWVLGVPWDMVQRARKEQTGQAMIDVQDLVRINVNRILHIADQTGLLMTAFISFALTVMALLGFVFSNEFSQAMFLLGLPLSIVAIVSAATARRIRIDEPMGEALYKRLNRHRVTTQVIGMLSIFVTAVWGMLQNMQASVLF